MPIGRVGPSFCPAGAVPSLQCAWLMLGGRPERKGQLVFWLEHEMYFEATLLIGAMEEGEVASLAQHSFASLTLQGTQRIFCRSISLRGMLVGVNGGKGAHCTSVL